MRNLVTNFGVSCSTTSTAFSAICKSWTSSSRILSTTSTIIAYTRSSALRHWQGINWSYLPYQRGMSALFLQSSRPKRCRQWCPNVPSPLILRHRHAILLPQSIQCVIKSSQQMTWQRYLPDRVSFLCQSVFHPWSRARISWIGRFSKTASPSTSPKKIKVCPTRWLAVAV